MTLSFLFWLLYVLWIVLGVYRLRWVDDRYAYGGGALLAALVFILGWRVFGFILQG